MSLADVERLVVPSDVVFQTEDGLCHAGEEGYEVFVLWSGLRRGSEVHVRTPHLPRQSSYKTKSGLFVRVEGEALHKLNAWLHQNEELLVAQVHAHPTEAFHSETDDAYPIVTTLGGFSIVAADFARDGLFTERTALFRLHETGWVDAGDPSDSISVVP